MLKYAYELGVKLALSEEDQQMRQYLQENLPPIFTTDGKVYMRTGENVEDNPVMSALGAAGGGLVGAASGGLLGGLAGRGLGHLFNADERTSTGIGGIAGALGGAGLGGYLGHRLARVPEDDVGQILTRRIG